MAVRLFTSESVTEGHPDKMADQISDAILDDLLGQDPRSRVAVETLLTTGQVHVAGEVTTDGFADVMQIVRQVVLDIGYDSSIKGFDGESCGIQVSIGKQSQDIAQGVDTAFEQRTESSHDPIDAQGAGDQGLMFGYATDETPSFMPLPIDLAHRLAERLTAVRKSHELPYLRPDGKSQVTIEYDGNTPLRIDAIVVSTQHSPDVTNEQMFADIRAQIISEELFKKVTADVKVADADVKAYYDKNPTTYTQAESRDVRHILVKTLAVANDVYKQVVALGPKRILVVKDTAQKLAPRTNDSFVNRKNSTA